MSTKTQAYLQVFVEDAPHSRKGAIVSLMFDEPRLGCTKLLWVDKNETPRLSKGLQHERCQPREIKHDGFRVRQIKMGVSEGKRKEIKEVSKIL